MSPRRAAASAVQRHISFEDMAARRAERLVNLVICLLSTRQFLTAERIRDAIPGYEPADGDPRTDEAFKRMFERDKAELRDLGVPLETGRNSMLDTEDGYRITRRRYELPPIQFEPAEAAAVGLAARLWQSATLGTPARNALIKLRAGGTDVEAAATPGAFPHVDASDPTLPAFLDAARNAQAVQFDYVKTGSSDAERRTVEPWGVLSWRRRWYVAGHDRDRGDARSFRLSRVVGDVDVAGKAGAFQRPPDVDLLALVTGQRAEHTRTARVQVRGSGAGRLRRFAAAETDGILTFRFTDARVIAPIVASAGSNAVVLEPPDLIEAVVEQLLAVKGAAVSDEPFGPHVPREAAAVHSGIAS
jgi:proteasome accessory factor B